MRALLPETAADVDVHAFYAADWIDCGGIRMNFVASADGAAQVAGKSAGLQTDGDNAVFAALRDLADVVLVGAGTVTIEGYRAVRLAARRRAIRRTYGLPEALPTAVISRSLRFDPESTLFTDTQPDARTIVLTCEAAPVERRTALAQSAEVAICGGDLVEPDLARKALADRGLTRVLCEGGPITFAALAAAGVVDELCLSMTPLLVGPGPTRVTDGLADWPEPFALTLTGLLEEDGALFLRYRFGEPRAVRTRS